MSVLWTDLIDPATLTGYIRESLAAYEARRGTLARWLPNREVADIVVRFFKGQTGLIDVARFRAFDAEPEVGKRQALNRVTLELPALGQTIPVSEYEQLRLRGNVSDEQALATILNAVPIVVRAVADAIEWQRGIVLTTGNATIDQPGFKSDDDFGRRPEHTVTAEDFWDDDPSVSRIEFLQEILDDYEATNGSPAGAIVSGRKVFRSLASGDEFQTQLLNGGARPATAQQVQDTLLGAGFPEFTVYQRRVSLDGVATPVIPDGVLLLLPEPVDVDDWEGTELGATFWGQTLTSTDSAWQIEESEQPGVVAGVYRNPKPPMGIEIISDAIGLPVLANADLSLAATVLDDETGS